MPWFAMNDDRISFPGNLVTPVPNLFNEWAGGVEFFSFDTEVTKHLLDFKGCTECRNNYDIIMMQTFEWNNLFSISVLQKSNSPVKQVCIDLRVVNHFT